MSNLVRFEKVDNELNILRIGGKSFLPPDVETMENETCSKEMSPFTCSNTTGCSSSLIIAVSP